MKNYNIKLLNIIFYIAYALLLLFGLVKVIVWSSHRTLTDMDYQILLTGISRLLVYSIWFLFATIYNSKNKCRMPATVSFSFISILAVLEIYRKMVNFKSLFFQDHWNSKSPFDQFTSLFELIYIIIFAISFAAYFITLIIKKYFKKSS